MLLITALALASGQGGHVEKLPSMDVANLRGNYRCYAMLLHDGKLLMGSHSHGRQWEFFGGGKDEHPDKDKWATLKREYLEETGHHLPPLTHDKGWMQTGNKFYKIATATRDLHLGPGDHGKLHGDGELHQWKLFSIHEAKHISMRGDHAYAFKKALQKGYIH